MSSKNLWVDLGQIEKVRSPRTVLLEQAQYLTQATKGTLVGRVGDEITRLTNFHYNLDVQVPALNNYTVNILSLDHDVDLYPVRLISSRPKTDVTCADEAELERAVESVLSSPAVKTTLSRLLSQLT